MNFSIYSTETKEVVAVISGNSNSSCESKADDMGYMGSSDFGATYSDMSDSETESTVYINA